ncbi:hypothetical protein BOX15_Mlig024491g1, partial [Macrostomum lignano]
AVAPEGVNQEEWRYMLLERVARESLPEAVTPDKAAAWELRCFVSLDAALLGRSSEPMLLDCCVSIIFLTVLPFLLSISRFYC